MFRFIAPFLLLLLSRAAEGSTLQECIYCLTDQLPDTVKCDIDSPTCDLSKCGLGTEDVDFAACGCEDCVEPIVTCFDECTPPCLDTVVEPFVDCMVTPECYAPCISEFAQEEPESVAVFPLLEKPQPCTLLEFLEDPVPCLFPVFPACGPVQAAFVEPTCDLVSCCPTCHAEMTDIFDCFYNWASGRSCDFSCPANRVRELALWEDEKAVPKRGKKDQKQRKLNPPTEGVDMSFVEECREMIAHEILEKPEDFVGAYMQCVISNTMERVTSDANKPQEMESTLPEVNGDSGAGSSHVRGIGAVVTIIAMALSFTD